MRTWVEAMVDEYSEGKKALEKLKDSYDENDLDEQNDRKAVNSMISTMEYSLDWMKKGRRPGNRRGAERRAVYQRTAYMEMDIFPELEEEKREIPIEMKRKLVDILMELSDRERECYLMHMTKGFSFAQIANFLGVSRSSVQRYIERAKKKIKNVA
ncbi:hypothetical protein CHH69_17435 [Terribacillus saccharophilus]|uniref:sigma-70 family RNA polymerase sigma factor n=1 Tax=Terribacillus saccharophilus TaxID=361277 RepID=UPI000BA70842|nr:sigma-70 family RNA polymerase sigma factor [Terribacillus saccharophilus]PAF34133.1 hypothetical protein CHH69_17435 [Terribacillus saccharophilus]